MTAELQIDDAAAATDTEPDYEQYRALSTPAALSLALGLLSPLTFFSWGLGAIPLLGLLLGIRGWRQVRARPAELAGLRAAQLGVIFCALFLVGGWGYLAYDYATEVPPGYERISYSLLRPPAGQEQAVPTAQATDLHGKKVFLKGYIYPQSGEKYLRFLLCRDNGDCCFGGTPPPGDTVLVSIEGDKPIHYSPYLRKVAGKFRVEASHVGAEGAGTVQVVVYHIDEAIVQ
jgi:hypothetical protein